MQSVVCSYLSQAGYVIVHLCQQYYHKNNQTNFRKISKREALEQGNQLHLMVKKVKVKGVIPIEDCRQDVHLHHWASKPVGGYTTWSVTHDRCNSRHMVTFPATEHCHCSLDGNHSCPAEARKLSWPEWLVTYWSGIPVHPLHYKHRAWCKFSWCDQCH